MPGCGAITVACGAIASPGAVGQGEPIEDQWAPGIDGAAGKMLPSARRATLKDSAERSKSKSTRTTAESKSSACRQAPNHGKSCAELSMARDCARSLSWERLMSGSWVVIDHRERKASLVAELQREDAGSRVRWDRRILGDYLIDGRLLIERKSLLDLCESIKDGRLFTQAQGMAELLRSNRRRAFQAARTSCVVRNERVAASDITAGDAGSRLTESNLIAS
jgi:hypothetical protein